MIPRCSGYPVVPDEICGIWPYGVARSYDVIYDTNSSVFEGPFILSTVLQVLLCVQGSTYPIYTLLGRFNLSKVAITTADVVVPLEKL